MARKKNKTKPIKVKDPVAIARRRRIMMHTLGVVLLVGSCSWGFFNLKNYVEKDVVFSTRPPTVVIKDRPVWMSDALAIEIINSVKPTGSHSAYDRQLLIDTASTLKSNPWIKKVNQVRRAYGQKPGDTLEIDCDFRAPVAMVHWKDYYWLIDGEGTKLPEQYTLSQAQQLVRNPQPGSSLRVIEGVQSPPVQAGQHWAGNDLAAGIEMAKLIYTRPSASEIDCIDVSNFNGREDQRESQINLITRRNSQVRWGRPISASDAFVEVPAAQKLANLDQIVAQYGRVDGGQPWIDIRFDHITYPSQTATLEDGKR